MRTAQEIVADINQFKPEDVDWLMLDSLLHELWQTGNQENYTADLLAVFERFPEEDGSGVFWSIVHGIECFKIYEASLVESLNRQPSLMGLLMLSRIKNTGAKTIAGIELNKFIEDLLSNTKITLNLRQELVEIRDS